MGGSNDLKRYSLLF